MMLWWCTLDVLDVGPHSGPTPLLSPKPLAVTATLSVPSGWGHPGFAVSSSRDRSWWVGAVGLAGAIQQNAGTLCRATGPGGWARPMGSHGARLKVPGWPGVGACAPGPGIIPKYHFFTQCVCADIGWALVASFIADWSLEPWCVIANKVIPPDGSGVRAAHAARFDKGRAFIATLSTC